MRPSRERESPDPRPIDTSAHLGVDVGEGGGVGGRHGGLPQSVLGARACGNLWGSGGQKGRRGGIGRVSRQGKSEHEKWGLDEVG